jgi:DNA (cytosine-5)-methyltransferase 1
VCVTGEVTHALTSIGSDASEDGTGRGTPIVTEPRLASGPVAHTLTCHMVKSGDPSTDNYVIEPRAFVAEGDTRSVDYGPLSPPLRVGSGLGIGSPPAVHLPGIVRRLTPLECERLQGFADGYTGIPGAKDAPRYAALGNSMAVPVMRWIGRRIDVVENSTIDLASETGT